MNDLILHNGKYERLSDEEQAEINKMKEESSNIVPEPTAEEKLAQVERTLDEILTGVVKV